jgi:hypothetical protein
LRARPLPPFKLDLRRLCLLGIGASAAVACGLASSASATSAAELAELLGRTCEQVVAPADLRWEPSKGALDDLVFGRSLLFLGSPTAGAPRDVFRARVRVSPEGQVLGVVSATNLTATPLGDDHALVAQGGHAAYATWAYGREQSVTALDLEGEGTQNTSTKLLDRAMSWVTNVQQTGTSAGIGRIDVTFSEPPHRVGLALGEDALVIDAAFDEHGARRRGRLDLAKGELSGNEQMHADAGKHLPKRFVHWAVDTVRAVSWIGPAPIAWFEEKTFAARDMLKQALFKATSSGDALAKEEPAPAAVLDTSQASLDLGHWPPAPVRSMWKTPEPGEGEWTLPKQPWLKTLPEVNGEKPPSPFYETFVRPDDERPYAKVLLVAMDMRQLDVGMEAGSEDPKPLTGPPGAGRIPRDPKVYQRVGAAFNGGFKTEHGNYGMMLNKRVLLPPVPGAATVILTKDGHVGMGSWGSNTQVGGIVDVPTADILSFRQNLDPLVDNDKVNPQNRGQWGFVLPGTSMQTERSGICVTNAGHMIYAWGDDTSATSLGRAMKMAGCIYGMHLDMNPHHTGFMYTNINEFKGKQYKSELLTKEMEIDTDRYLLYAPKDFFFMMLHDPRPAIEGLSFTPDAGAQPAPSWMAGLWRARAGDVDVFDVEPGRASFRVRAGTKETEHEADAPTAKASRAARGTELSEDDAHRVLFAITVGMTDPKHPHGLAADGHIALPLTNEHGSALITITEEGALSIATSGTVPPKGDAVELPLVIDEAAAVPSLPRARQPVVLATTAEGRIVISRGPSLEAVVRELVRIGCTRAVLLDRGLGNHGTMFRAGTASPPRAHYDETTLFAMSKPLVPRGFRFEAAHPVEPPKKK